MKTAHNLITNATKFSDIGLRGSLISALEKHYQIIHPTVAQKAFIPAILSGGDLFIRDLTGSGKTFGLSLAAVAYPRFMTAHRHDQLLTSDDQIKDSNINDKVHRGKAIYDELVIHDQNQDPVPDTEGNNKLRFTGTEKIKREQDRYIHTLMMVPTRDLAIQVFDWIKGFTRSYIHGDDMAYMAQCIISGPDAESQKLLLKRYTPRIVVGTPNRLLELYDSQDLDFSRLRLLIVDEADRIVKTTSSQAPVKRRFNAKIHKADGELLLEKLFNSEKKGKYQYAKFLEGESKIQVVACSASINSSLRNEFRKNQWVVNPLHVDTTGSLSLPNTLKHSAYVVQTDGLYFFDWSIPEERDQAEVAGDSSKDVIRDKSALENIKTDEKAVETNDDSGKKSKAILVKTEGKKVAALADDDPLVVESIKYLIEQGKFSSGFIFTSSSISVRKLVANLQSVGVDALRFIDIRNYEEKSQSNNITSEKSLPNWLVLTEHEARGLDLPTASTVFILGPPSSPQSYLHMAGRVGRAGRMGNVVSLLGGSVYEKKFRSMANILKLSPSLNK